MRRAEGQHHYHHQHHHRRQHLPLPNVHRLSQPPPPSPGSITVIVVVASRNPPGNQGPILIFISHCSPTHPTTYLSPPAPSRLRLRLRLPSPLSSLVRKRHSTRALLTSPPIPPISLTHSFTHSLIYSLIHSFIHSFIHSPQVVIRFVCSIE